jgi:hypothetical protein
MNIDNAVKLIEKLKDENTKFNMGSFIYQGNKPHDWLDTVTTCPEYHCGTAGCIAGWAALLSGETRGSVSDIAMEQLDISMQESEWLFYGGFNERNGHSLKEINRYQAIEAIEWLMSGYPVKDDDGNDIILNRLEDPV